MAFNVLKIKGLLKEKNISYESLCGEIGITKQTLINYFNSRSKVDVLTLEKIAKYLEVDVNYFFEGMDSITQANNCPSGLYIEDRIKVLEEKVARLEDKK